MKNDLKNLIKRLVKKTLERVKFLILILLTIGALFGGVWFGVNSVISGGVDILIFIVSSLGVWFGVGMIDMFNDINKQKMQTYLDYLKDLVKRGVITEKEMLVLWNKL